MSSILANFKSKQSSLKTLCIHDIIMLIPCYISWFFYLLCALLVCCPVCEEVQEKPEVYIDLQDQIFDSSFEQQYTHEIGKCI